MLPFDDRQILSALILLMLFRDAALSMAEQQIKNLQLKFDSALSRHQSEKEAWDRSLQNVEETWRCSAIIFFLLTYFDMHSFYILDAVNNILY